MEEYKIVAHDSKSNMEEEIEKLFSEGWICQGGIFIASNPDQIRFTQAMIKPIVTVRGVRVTDNT